MSSSITMQMINIRIDKTNDSNNDNNIINSMNNILNNINRSSSSSRSSVRVYTTSLHVVTIIMITIVVSYLIL